MRSACNMKWRMIVAGVALLVASAVGTRAAGDTAAVNAESAASPNPLLWDAMAKTIEARPGDGAGDFAFTVTNTSDHAVTIEQLRPTCGCTVAEMPSSPWVLAPGASGTFTGTIDFRGKDGTVTAKTPGSITPVQVGALQLANFINPAGLQSLGENLYQETASSGTPSANTPGTNGLGTVNQGYVETSNVNVVEELVNMIQTQRAYEINSKAIQSSDQMLQRLSQL